MNNEHHFYDVDENRQLFNFPFFPGFPGFPGSGGGSQFPGPGGGPPPPFPGGPGGGGQSSGPPTSPPPSFTPQKSQVQTFAIDPGAIRRCLFRFTYVWLRREAFWFFPVFIGRRSIAGYRWTGFRWVYFGIDLERIESFQCF